jgi:hypothetical protein
MWPPISINQSFSAVLIATSLHCLQQHGHYLLLRRENLLLDKPIDSGNGIDVTLAPRQALACAALAATINPRKDLPIMRLFRFSLAAGLALSASLVATAQSPLDTKDQKALDNQSLRLLASQPVQAEVASATQTMAADPYVSTKEGRAILPHAVSEIVYAGVVDAINRDPARPRLQWLWAPVHTLSGISVPTSKVLMPNVDNVFRIFPVDDRHHYRLTAHSDGPTPIRNFCQGCQARMAGAR